MKRQSWIADRVLQFQSRDKASPYGTPLSFGEQEIRVKLIRDGKMMEPMFICGERK